MENKLPQTPQRLQKPTISMQIFVVLFLVILYPFLLASLVRGILSFQWPSPPGNSRRHERIDPIPDVASEFLLTLPPPVFPLSIKALPISTIIYKRNQNSTKDHWLTLFRKCLIWLLSPRIEPVCCFLPIHLDPCKASWKNSHLPTGTPFPPSATRQTLLKKKKKTRALCQIIQKTAVDLTSLISSCAKCSALPIGKAWDTEVTQTSLSRHRSKHAYVILGWW